MENGWTKRTPLFHYYNNDKVQLWCIFIITSWLFLLLCLVFLRRRGLDRLGRFRLWFLLVVILLLRICFRCFSRFTVATRLPSWTSATTSATASASASATATTAATSTTVVRVVARGVRAPLQKRSARVSV